MAVVAFLAALAFSSPPPSAMKVSRVLLAQQVRVTMRAESEDSSDSISAAFDGEWSRVRVMKVSDIKAELELRSIDFSGCFEKDDLVRRLVLAREQGEADPTLVDAFNEKSLERSLHKSGGADDAAFDPFAAAKADGVDQLPGGMSPEMVQKLANNPELMAVLQNPKMQEVLKAVMEKGPLAYAQYSGNSEIMAMIRTFTSAMGQ